MERETLNSSNLRSAGYDAAEQILEIEFHGGRVYQYLPVPDRLWWGLLDAASKGQYFNEKINDQFHCVRIR